MAVTATFWAPVFISLVFAASALSITSRQERDGLSLATGKPEGWLFSPRATFPDGVEVPVANSVNAFAESLWERVASKELIAQALATDYIQGIGQGNLTPEAYGSFNLQDAVYIAKAQENFELVVSKMSASSPLKAYYQGKIISYTQYKQDLFTQWRIGDSSAIELSEAARNYIEFEETVAAMNEPEWYLLANFPCYHLWSVLATQLEGVSPPANLYRPWIEVNKSNSSSVKLAALINNHAALFEANRKLAENIFTAALQFEVAMFASATPCRRCKN